jgi:hypothetical protein
MKKYCLSMMAVFMLFLVQYAISDDDTATDALTMTVDEIAVLDVSGTLSTLTVTAPDGGGEEPIGDTDANTYLQYTSTVESGDERSVSAELTTDEHAPSGCLLQLRATIGSGDGEGTSAGIKTITSTSAQTIITGITSCATGTGLTSGARLTYTLVVDDPTELVANETEIVTVLFTLTDPAD